MPPLLRFCVCIALTALYGSACAPAAYAQVTLDFENLSNPDAFNGFGANSQGHSVTQNGFSITDTTTNGLGLRSVAPNGGKNNLNYTGSVALYNFLDGGVTTLKQNNGNPFSLVAVDIAARVQPSKPLHTVSVVFTGSIQGGGTVTQMFTHEAGSNLETVVFGSDFTNLLSVAMGSRGLPYQFDNIVAAPAAVPEHGSLALLVSVGVSGAGFLVRRRKQPVNVIQDKANKIYRAKACSPPMPL